jgi:hypothetical protein
MHVGREPDESVCLVRTELGVDRIEINRSARGGYYWKLVVNGPIDDAVARALSIDSSLSEHYGNSASQPEDVEA